MSVAQQIALRLIGLRQAGLAAEQPWRRSFRRSWETDLAVWAAWLQTRPDELAAVLHLLATEIATDRQLHGLDIVDVPTPEVPPDPALEITGDAEQLLLDRLGAMLRGVPDWEIRLTLEGGESVTARPARIA